MKILSIFWKNLETVFNSKLSSLILILGPIFLILIIGSALQDTSLKNISLGFYIDADDDISNFMVEKLEAESFNVHVESNLIDCINNVVSSKTHGCLEVRRTIFEHPIAKNQNVYYDADLYVDFSKQRIVWGIIGSVKVVVDNENSRIRDIAVTRLNEDLDNIINEIVLKQTILSTANNLGEKLDLELRKIESDLEILKIENEDLIDEIDNAKNEIEKAQKNVDDLLITLGPIIQNNFYFKRLEENINNIESTLGNASKIIGSTSGKLRSINVDTSQNYIFTINNNIRETQDYLSELRNELDEIRNVDVDRATDPVSLSYKSASNVDTGGVIVGKLGFIDYLFPSFIMLFILLVSIVFAATMTIRERTSGAYIRNITSGASGFNFVFSNFMTNFIVVVIQVFLLVIISSFFLNLSVFQNILSFSANVTIAVSFFVLIGLLIGYIFNSQESAIIASVSVALLFIIFSPLVSPVEVLPPGIARVVSMSPLVLLETNLRQALIFELPFNLSLSGIFTLAFGFLVTILLLFTFYKMKKRKEI